MILFSPRTSLNFMSFATTRELSLHALHITFLKGKKKQQEKKGFGSGYISSHGSFHIFPSPKLFIL